MDCFVLPGVGEGGEGSGREGLKVCVGELGGHRGVPGGECFFCLPVNCGFKDLVLVLSVTFVGLGLSKSH